MLKLPQVILFYNMFLKGQLFAVWLNDLLGVFFTFLVPMAAPHFFGTLNLLISTFWLNNQACVLRAINGRFEVWFWPEHASWYLKTLFGSKISPYRFIFGPQLEELELLTPIFFSKHNFVTRIGNKRVFRVLPLR